MQFSLPDQIQRHDVFARLLTFPNVLVTGHQAFFTAEALGAIASTTIAICRRSRRVAFLAIRSHSE